MRPEQLIPTLDLLRQASEAISEMPVDTLPDDLRARLISASVRVESIMLSLMLIQESLDRRGGH
jgi:hypothetical protein